MFNILINYNNKHIYCIIIKKKLLNDVLILNNKRARECFFKKTCFDKSRSNK